MEDFADKKQLNDMQNKMQDGKGSKKRGILNLILAGITAAALTLSLKFGLNKQDKIDKINEAKNRQQHSQSINEHERSDDAGFKSNITKNAESICRIIDQYAKKEKELQSNPKRTKDDFLKLNENFNVQMRSEIRIFEKTVLDSAGAYSNKGFVETTINTIVAKLDEERGPLTVAEHEAKLLEFFKSFENKKFR